MSYVNIRKFGWVSLLLLACTTELPATEPPNLAALLRNSHRVVFLGDSITAAGVHVAFFEAWLLTQPAATRPLVIDVGLPSETVSGLSEAGHAGGQFPRPDLAERLDRVLAIARPDLVIACYGINCGIYQPFDAERFAKYQRGIVRLRDKILASGAQLVLVTPPFYDEQRAAGSPAYNQVLDHYSDWLLEHGSQGWPIIDLHTPMTDYVKQRRQQDPTYTLQPDGVHPNREGYWFIAQQLIQGFGGETAAAAETPELMLQRLGIPVEVLPLLEERVAIRRDAYVAAAGHKRPGVAAGRPIDQAEQVAHDLTSRITAMLDTGQAPADSPR